MITKIADLLNDSEVKKGVFTIDPFSMSVHMTADVFLNTFEEYDIAARSCDTYPWKIYVVHRDVEFFAIISDEDRKELQI